MLPFLSFLINKNFFAFFLNIYFLSNVIYYCSGTALTSFLRYPGQRRGDLCAVPDSAEVIFELCRTAPR